MNSQVYQAHVTSLLCKWTFSQESRFCVTNNRWDFEWEIQYWDLRTLNIIILTYLSIKQIKDTFDIFLCFLVWNQRFRRFFGCYCLIHVTLFIIQIKGSTEKQLAVQTQARSHPSVSLSGCDWTELPHTVVKDIWAQVNIILERYHVLAPENATFCVTEFDNSFTVKQNTSSSYRCSCKRFLSTDDLCQHVLAVPEKRSNFLNF